MVNKITTPPTTSELIGTVNEIIDDKQDLLVSGTNIKTINNESLLGSGNISIGGGASYTAGTGIDITNDVISVTNAISNGASAGATAIQPNDNISELNNDAGYITGIDSGDVTTALGYTPYNSSNPSGFITSSALTPYALSSSLATVATSGDYDDLSNKPTIPTVNNASFIIQKNGTNVATFTANASSNVIANISVPNTVSSVSSSSTNADAVGAKLFYDTVGDIEAALHTINSGGAQMVNLSWSYDYIYSAGYSIKVNGETVASSGASSISETLIGSYAVGSEVKVTFGAGEPYKGKIQLYVNNVLTEELTITTTKTYTFLLEEETVIRIVYQDKDIGPVEPV